MPFMDWRLVEFLCSVPPAYKLHGGWTKWLARAAMASTLPTEIVWRRDKQGWPIPEQEWFGGPLARLAGAAARRQRLRARAGRTSAASRSPRAPLADAPARAQPRRVAPPLLRGSRTARAANSATACCGRPRHEAHRPRDHRAPARRHPHLPQGMRVARTRRLRGGAGGRRRPGRCGGRRCAHRRHRRAPGRPPGAHARAAGACARRGARARSRRWCTCTTPSCCRWPRRCSARACRPSTTRTRTCRGRSSPSSGSAVAAALRAVAGPSSATRTRACAGWPPWWRPRRTSRSASRPSRGAASTVANYPFPEELAPPAAPRPRERAVCYVGGIMRTRGACEMVRAMARLPGVRLLLAGRFEDAVLEAALRAEPGWAQVDYLRPRRPRRGAQRAGARQRRPGHAAADAELRRRRCRSRCSSTCPPSCR